MATGRRLNRTPGWPALLVIGLIALRALVPSGFMLAPVDGKIALVLCEPGMMTGMMGMAGMAGGHHHHHPGPDSSPHDPGAGDNSDCPYAQSGGSAPLPSIPLLPGTVAAQRCASSPAVTQTAFTPGPRREQTSRGPPVVA